MSGPVLALSILFAILSDAAYALIVGCLLAEYWLDASAEHSASGRRIFLVRRLRLGSLACAGALTLNQIVRPWFAAASMSGSGSFAGNLALIPDILSSTHQGKLWYIDSAALVALLAAALFAARKTEPVTAAWTFRVSLFLIACTKAASGHAANEGDFTLAEFSMLLHVLAISVWGGAVIASGLLVLPWLVQFPDPAAFWSYGRLLSRTVTWALLAILISGIYSSDRELNGALSGLWSSGWGRILMTKVAFVLLALSLGAFCRFKCVQRPASRTAELMVRLVRAEAVVMMLILCLSGTLAKTPPAISDLSLTGVSNQLLGKLQTAAARGRQGRTREHSGLRQFAALQDGRKWSFLIEAVWHGRSSTQALSNGLKGHA